MNTVMSVRTYLPTVALNSSTRRHQLLMSVHTYASDFIAYSRFSSIEMYSEEEKEINGSRMRLSRRKGGRDVA